MSSRLQDVIIRDTRANQLAATLYPAGTLYFVTDEAVLERSSGSAWESYGGVGDDSITDAKLRESGALSVIGRSANSTGNPADISAVAASGSVLRESGSTLGFGTIATAGIADDAVTFAKMQNISTDTLLGRETAASGNVEEITLGNAQVLLSTTLRTLKTIGAGVGGGGSAPSTGLFGRVRVPWACTITKVTLSGDVSGSAVIDIWKDTHANYPPTVADTITAAAKPTLSSAITYEDSTLTGWTTSISAGDWLFFNLDSVTTCTVITVILEVRV